MSFCWRGLFWLDDLPAAHCRLSWPVHFASLIAFSFLWLQNPGVKAEDTNARLITGKAAMGDWTSDAPGDDPQFLYVANTDGVIRFPYRNGDLKARGQAEKLSAKLSGGAARLRSGGHWTRDIVFSPGGKKMFVSIGSRSNDSDNAAEADRARIFELNPDGTGQKVYAWGIRNAVCIAFRPGSDELWMSTNERDE